MNNHGWKHQRVFCDSDTAHFRQKKAAEQLASLPEGPEFGVQRYEITEADRERGYAEIAAARCDVHDGIRFIDSPIPPDLVSFWSDDTDVISWRDEDGIVWTLGRYAGRSLVSATAIGSA